MQGAFGSRSTVRTQDGPLTYFRLEWLEELGVRAVHRLPHSIKVLLENVLRHAEQGAAAEEDVLAVARWGAGGGPGTPSREIPFHPARVIHQDYTGVAAMVDMAAMRSAVQRLGGDPERVNPDVPTDFVIDHSVQVDYFGGHDAFALNVEKEFERNRERYIFLRWAQQAFRNFRVVPPGTGIVHQVNLEYLATVVQARREGGETVAYPDTLVATDSHTTMINGLGVLGWGVGGIEAEAAMLGRPLHLLLPEVVGVRLTGELRPGVTATDLVLTITHRLRQLGVVGKFAEFFGPGLDHLSLADRATVANMAPEYGATMGFFPVDDETLRYLRLTGRDPGHVDLVERYTRLQGLFRSADAPEPAFTEVAELDLAAVETSLAGPHHPKDRVSLSDVRRTFAPSLSPNAESKSQIAPAPALSPSPHGERAGVRGEAPSRLADGAVVIAAITSCTNTSNPSVMIGAGLLARKAVERGLAVPPYVKTSLAPGSPVVVDYLVKSGLMRYLEALGFHLVGFGCTTCAGGSGPLPDDVASAIREYDLTVAAVLSGNRNFEGRIHPLCKLAYLASPPLVVAYALAGTVDIDLTREPLGRDALGQPVYLRDVWPTDHEIREALERAVAPALFRRRYAEVFTGDARWQALPVLGGQQYAWDPASTYIQEPPFFKDLAPEPEPVRDIRGARALAVLGDSVTTDHISPAGAIPSGSPAGQYLRERGVKPADFSVYGARRGNHEVMVRGTFANIRLRNQLVPGKEGGWTAHQPSGEVLPIYDAAARYRAEGVPLIVLAGQEYGAGSSRDWAAKGTALLGVRAILAESFERIHRSNLVGMGVLPLQFRPGENKDTLGLTGREVFDIEGVGAGLSPGQVVTVRAQRPDYERRFRMVARLDTPTELEYYRHGGILPFGLRQLLRGAPAAPPVEAHVGH